MEITGKIIAVLEKQSGTSKRTGNQWSSQEYVIETHEQYPRKCCFRVFGDDKINQFAIKAAEELTVSIDIDAHEYQGRWFNQVNAWSVKRAGEQTNTTVDQTTEPAEPTAPVPPAPAAKEDGEALPF